MAQYQPVTHVLFDMDGLLLDTEDLYTIATQQVVSQYGKDYTWDIKCTIMGFIGRDVAVALVKALDLPLSPEEFMEATSELLSQLFPTCRLLPDTESLYTTTIQQIANRHGGKTFTWEMKCQLMGLMGREAAVAIIQTLELPIKAEEYMSSSQQIMAQMFPSCHLLPGAERLLRHLHSKGVNIALATSSSRENYELKTTHHKSVFELFHHIVTGSSDPDVKRGKPEPDIFLICASRFPEPCPKPHNCLVFEDAPNGVKAARAAGMQVVMVPDSRMDPLLTQDATLVLKSLEDFQPELFGLPAYD